MSDSPEPPRVALELLERQAAAEPHAEYAVDDRRFAARARQLLDEAHTAR